MGHMAFLPQVINSQMQTQTAALTFAGAEFCKDKLSWLYFPPEKKSECCTSTSATATSDFGQEGSN